MRTYPVILGLLALCIFTACDKLSDFEQELVGTWESVSYVADTTDLSSDHHAKLVLEKNGDCQFHYPYQEGTFSYLLIYEALGKWTAHEADSSISFEGISGGWSDISAVLGQDGAIRMAGSFKGRQISIVFERK